MIQTQTLGVNTPHAPDAHQAPGFPVSFLFEPSQWPQDLGTVYPQPEAAEGDAESTVTSWGSTV